MLLVSTLTTTPMMEICDSNKDLINSNNQKKVKLSSALGKDTVLCKHCKRTPSNGIRCLGMCVADNDY